MCVCVTVAPCHSHRARAPRHSSTVARARATSEVSPCSRLAARAAGRWRPTWAPRWCKAPAALRCALHAHAGRLGRRTRTQQRILVVGMAGRGVASASQVSALVAVSELESVRVLGGTPHVRKCEIRHGRRSPGSLRGGTWGVQCSRFGIGVAERGGTSPPVGRAGGATR